MTKKNKNFRMFAVTPPKGWNSWDCFGASVTEQEVRESAKVMCEKLKDTGWEYVVVDIQWYEPTADSSRYHTFAPLCMDEYARLTPASNRFPSAKNGMGFKELADYVHSLGLKFGIHIMRGIPRQAVYQQKTIKGTDKTAADIALNNICPWNSDMYGVNVEMPEGQKYYDSLIELYASWGVDFLKVDDIADSKLYGAHLKEIEAIRKAIDQVGRPMVLSLSPGPASLKDGAFLQENANMWRLTDDYWDRWDALLEMFKKCEEWAPFIRSGNWPDCDMLPLGHIGMRSVDGGGTDRWTRFTKEEQRTMMTLWSIMQSPLMFGGDLRDLDDETLQLITDPVLTEMHQTLCEQRQILRTEQMILWYGCNSVKEYYVVFNLSDVAIEYDIGEYTGEKNVLRVSGHGCEVVEQNKRN